MFEFFIFAFVTAITPGPNNSMLMASSLKFGRKASIPHFLGIWLGFTFLFFVGGFALSLVPVKIFDYLQYVGYAVITYIAFKVATSSTTITKESVEKPFTFIQACLFQWINPKGVVMAVSGLTAFNITSNQGALIYFAVLPFCVGAWLFLGESLQNTLKKSALLARVIYVSLGLSMVASLLLA
ncbi:MAG: LysE family transporter [Pelagibacteraceae bacterium]|mgnify:FL=1|jgi:threonine/homoserine/homoserine lactone efflux protein